MIGSSLLGYYIRVHAIDGLRVNELLPFVCYSFFENNCHHSFLTSRMCGHLEDKFQYIILPCIITPDYALFPKKQQYFIIQTPLKSQIRFDLFFFSRYITLICTFSHPRSFSPLSAIIGRVLSDYCRRYLQRNNVELNGKWKGIQLKREPINVSICRRCVRVGPDPGQNSSFRAEGIVNVDVLSDGAINNSNRNQH